MAEITLSLTPKNLYEAVKLLKSSDFRIYYTVNSVEFHFPFSNAESRKVTQERFDQMEHLALLIQELAESSIPVDLDEFIKTYRRYPRQKFSRHRNKE